MEHDESEEHPTLPDDFSVEDIVRAAMPDRDEREARAALWEIDFALQEVGWLRFGIDREAALVASIISQIRYAARGIERTPVNPAGLSEELEAELGERFTRLTDALSAMPEAWADHEDLLAAHARLRHGLEQLGLDVS